MYGSFALAPEGVALNAPSCRRAAWRAGARVILDGAARQRQGENARESLSGSWWRGGSRRGAIEIIAHKGAVFSRKDVLYYSRGRKLPIAKSNRLSVCGLCYRDRNGYLSLTVFVSPRQPLPAALYENFFPIQRSFLC